MYISSTVIDKEKLVYYHNTLRPKGFGEWSYPKPLAVVTTGCEPVISWIVVLPAYYLAPFRAYNEIDFLKKFVRCIALTYSQNSYNVTLYNIIFNIQHKYARNRTVFIKIPTLSQNTN